MSAALQALMGKFERMGQPELDQGLEFEVEVMPAVSRREHAAIQMAAAMLGNPAMASYLHSHVARAMIATKAADALLDCLDATQPNEQNDEQDDKYQDDESADIGQQSPIPMNSR